MNKVFNIKSILLFQILYQMQIADCHYDETLDQHLESQSQENDFYTDEGEEYQNYKIQNPNFNYDNQNRVLQYSTDYNDCNSCACNKCENPPECCKAVCKSCSLSLQMLAMSQLPQFSMPISPELQMSLPQLLQILSGQNPVPVPQMQAPQMQPQQMQLPQMQLPQIPQVQMPRMQTPGQPFPFNDPGFIYLPLTYNVMNFLKNVTTTVSTTPKELKINNNSITTVAAPTIKTTTAAAKTKMPVTISSSDVKATSKEPVQIPKARLKQIEDNIVLEAALKSALSAYSASMRRAADKSNNHNNRYLVPSALRRTKPVISNKDPSRFGILPIPNNMADSLMLEARNAKGIRP